MQIARTTALHGFTCAVGVLRAGPGSEQWSCVLRSRIGWWNEMVFCAHCSSSLLWCSVVDFIVYYIECLLCHVDYLLSKRGCAAVINICMLSKTCRLWYFYVSLQHVLMAQDQRHRQTCKSPSTVGVALLQTAIRRGKITGRNVCKCTAAHAAQSHPACYGTKKTCHSKTLATMLPKHNH